MKNRFLKLYIVAFFLGSTFMMFAQPGADDTGGGLESADPAAPIDNYVWIMALVGLTFVFLKFRTMYKKSNISIKQ